MSMQVWVTQTRGGHFHATDDCLGLKTSAHRTSNLVQMELSEVLYPNPCHRCFPEAPKLRIWRPICRQCGQSRPLPCPHNGGVQVYQPRRGQWTGKFGDSDYDPSSVTYVRRWVWPENAHRYTLVNPVL